jgi:hypothetical protein
MELINYFNSPAASLLSSVHRSRFRHSRDCISAVFTCPGSALATARASLRHDCNGAGNEAPTFDNASIPRFNGFSPFNAMP